MIKQKGSRGKVSPLLPKNGSELKLENRDDYFNSQLSSRLSSVLQTSTIHLSHVKHAQHFCRTTRCGRSAAYHRSCSSGRGSHSSTGWMRTEEILDSYSFLFLLKNGSCTLQMFLYCISSRINSSPPTVRQQHHLLPSCN